MASISKQEFLSRFGKNLSEGSAALFIGAGCSQASGHVNWRGLLESIATDIGLEVAKETDLLAVAQFHETNRGGRARINEVLIEEFNKTVQLTENHRLLASLPVRSIWTTNYDTLIEQSFAEARKRLDVKITSANLAQTMPHRDAVLYKMHGDKSQPQDAILTKGDYETYNEKRAAFSTVLKGDLIEHTFLFLGFSFTDPNIDFILARVRDLLGENQRDHFCVMKRPDAPSSGDPAKIADFEYECRKLELRIADLKRYQIQAVMIDSYSEITDILRALDRLAHSKDVFVSGSAADYLPFDRDRIEGLMIKLGSEFVKRGYRLVSGFGIGIGSAVAYGALSEIHSTMAPPSKAMLMPFPQILPIGTDRTAFNTAHREQMVRAAGFTVFVCGNRREGAEVHLAPGVLEEFGITSKLGRIPIPIGATGSAASQISAIVCGSLSTYYRNPDVESELKTLDDECATDEQYLMAIFSIIEKNQY